MAVWKGRYGTGKFYPPGYNSYQEYLDDDNGESFYGWSWDDKPTEKKEEEKPKDKPKDNKSTTPTYTPTPSDVGRSGSKPSPSQDWQNQPPPWWSEGPPQPVINFETPYQPSIRNRSTAVNNQSLKIGSSYQKPDNKGGTSGFKRSSTERKFSNSAMRINKSLTV